MQIDLTNYTTFGNLLQKLCHIKGVTMREVGKSLNISASYICDIQQGNRRPPKDEILFKIFEYFNLDYFQQLELLDLIHLEKQELDDNTAHFLKQNKKAAKIIKQITRIKNFDKLVKENPELLSNLQMVIDDLTLADMEIENENRF